MNLVVTCSYSQTCKKKSCPHHRPHVLDPHCAYKQGKDCDPKSHCNQVPYVIVTEERELP